MSDALGELGINAMQNRFLALIDGGADGAAQAAACIEVPAPQRAYAATGEGIEDVAGKLASAIEAGEWVAAVLR